MRNEFAQRQEKARDLMTSKGFGALVITTPQNIQYFTGVTEPSTHTCGVVIITQQAQPALAVLWLDQEVAQKQAQEVAVETYTPTSRGTVVIEILERLGGTKDTIAMDNRAFTGLGNALKRALPKVQLVDASTAIEEELRSVKSEEEIRLIYKEHDKV